MNRLFFIFLLVLSGHILAQTQEGIPITRSVTIENETSKSCFTIFVQNVDIKTSPKVLYYWFSDGKINQNIGGYSGFLLHGKYQVFVKSGQLIEQGAFINGVKEGVWNYWNLSGEKIKMVVYQNGWKNGNEVLYDSGNESEIIPYKMGVIHGDKRIYKQDTSITIRFRNGVEVKKKDKGTPKNRLKLFDKKEKMKKADESSDKEIPGKKIRAGALQYVVAMSLLIFFLMGMFMLQAHYSNLHVDEILIQERLYDQLSSAKVLLKNRPDRLVEEGKRELPLFEDSKLSLEVNNWGIYKLIALKAGYRHHLKKEIFLMGDDIWHENRSSLYLADRKRYLSLCGDTWIGGPTYLPSLGVRRSYVDGVGYYREKVIQGEIRKSKAELPAIRKDFSTLFDEQWKIDFERDSIVSWEDIEEEEISNSFYRKTLVMHSPQEIILENINLSGRIKVISDTVIKVLTTAEIDHCILIAPRVVFQRNCKMNCQVFAKDYVEIGQESVFTYPSLVIMNGYNVEKELVLQDSVHFAGELLVLGKQEKKMPKLKLKKSTTVEGFVYCDGIIEMEGDVAGSLYTNRFLLYTRSAMYENHLLNIRLDVEDLKKEYVGVSWFGEPVQKEIIEFLW